MHNEHKTWHDNVQYYTSEITDRNGFFERKFQITKLRTNNSCFGPNSELQYILKYVQKWKQNGFKFAGRYPRKIFNVEYVF